MTDINYKLLNMIKKGLSNDEICRELNISKKQLKYRLECIKREGFNLQKSFNYSGSFNYNLVFNKLCNCDKITIKNDLNKKGFRALAISDNHIGHSKDNIKYLDIIYDYCVKHNINIVFHCGDLLHGSKQYKRSPKEQLEFLIEDYPYCKDVLTFFAFGNHEEDFLHDFGINLKSVIEKYRDDIVPLGYGEQSIRLENVSDDIVISHEGKYSKPSGIRLAGHSHRYKFIDHDYTPLIVVPTLSDFLHTNDFPGAVDMYIESPSPNTRYLSLNHLIINGSNKIKQVSRIEHNSYKKYIRK